MTISSSTTLKEACFLKGIELCAKHLMLRDLLEWINPLSSQSGG